MKTEVEKAQDHQNAGLNKIAYLMEKLQEKIALRVIENHFFYIQDKKVQLLQNEVSDKSDFGGDDEYNSVININFVDWKNLYSVRMFM